VFWRRPRQIPRLAVGVVAVKQVNLQLLSASGYTMEKSIQQPACARYDDRYCHR
jgi:hypothetical protein